MYMLNMMNYFVLGMGLEGVFEEAKTQGTYALYIVFIFIGVYLGVKRAWALFASFAAGAGILVFFINKPDALKAIGTFLGGLVGHIRKGREPHARTKTKWNCSVLFRKLYEFHEKTI
jgi:hypothetical protein